MVSQGFNADPWGFVEKTFNMMSFYGPSGGPSMLNTQIFDDSAELRKEAKFIAVKIFETFDKNDHPLGTNVALLEQRTHSDESFFHCN